MIDRSYAARQQALLETEVRIDDAPDIVEWRFARARLLTELGHTDEARQAYLDILALEPGHFGALNNLGVLLHNTGFRTAARTVYAEAVAQHPDNPKGHVNYAHALLDNDELELARRHYEAALRLMPDHPEAHQGLTKYFTKAGDREQAFLHQQMGFQKQPVITVPYRGAGEPLRVLFIISAAGGNIPIQSFLDDRIFLVSIIVAEFYDPKQTLPPHNLAINAIGDADLCRSGLEAARKILAQTNTPIINPPAAVLVTGRVANVKNLSAIDRLVTPAIATLPRAILNQSDALSLLAGHGISFPFLLRTPGYHAGEHFVRVENSDDYAAALATLPGSELVAIQHLDASGADRKIRKYRVMFIDGQLYPVHLAVSDHWKIHYFSADMGNHPERRDEDAAFLNDMEQTIGAKAMQVLKNVGKVLGLDYGGIDFGFNQNGDVLLFEANATMGVTAPESDPCWLYRRQPIERIFDAIRRMLKKKATSAL